MRAEMVTIEPFARRCVRWPPRASREAPANWIPPPTFGQGEALSGETAGKKCTRRMDGQSLNNVALRFAHPPNSAPSEPLVEGKVRRPESGPSWRALQAATLGEGRTGGRDRRRAIMPIPPINSLVKYDHPVQVRRPPARVSRLPPHRLVRDTARRCGKQLPRCWRPGVRPLPRDTTVC